FCRVIYKIDETTGEYLQSSENTNILDDELNEIVIRKFQKFCCDENLGGFEQCKSEKRCNSESETYDYVSLTEIKNNEYYKVKPEFFLNTFREHMKRLIEKKAITLQEILKTQQEVLIENKQSVEVKDDKKY